jgi:hypothetical protein
MASILAKIIDLILKGKSKELLIRMQSNPELRQAVEDLNSSIANANKVIAQTKKEQQNLNL